MFAYTGLLPITLYKLPFIWFTLADPVVWVVANLGFCIMVLARRKSINKLQPKTAEVY